MQPQAWRKMRKMDLPPMPGASERGGRGGELGEGVWTLGAGGHLPLPWDGKRVTEDVIMWWWARRPGGSV